MLNCREIVDLIIQDDDESLQRAMRELFEQEEIRKIAVYYYRRYASQMELLSWEDLHSETITRFTETVRKNGPPKTNCKGFIRNICRNICEEYHRANQRSKIALDVLMRILQLPSSTVLREKIEACLKAIGGQCELLLHYYFLARPPIDDNEQLAHALGQHGYRVKGSVIPAVKTRCKAKFRDQLDNDPSPLFEE